MVVMIFDTWSMSNFSANNISATDKKKILPFDFSGGSADYVIKSYFLLIAFL